ncbi:MAG: DUF1573 domain-containing protein [Flavobacteriales bacterium]|nr:DUF1573 domain-containing protein [Flavobacteriales bacterium]
MNKDIMKLVYICFLAIAFTSCLNDNSEKITVDLVQNPTSAKQLQKDIKAPIISIKEDFFDFGELNQNESIKTEFIIKNIGNAPLLIRSVKASCGCTVPEWPKELIDIGGTAKIKVTFNSGSKKGKQNKTITLVTNAMPSTKVLLIKGTILVP